MPGVQAIPLQPEDRAILDLEDETVAGHTCKVIRLGEGAPDLGELRSLVADRIEAAPELLWSLGESGGAVAWVPCADFEIADRVRETGAVAEDGIAPLVASLFERRLDRARPLWRMDYAPVREGGAVLVWRIHHALADGTSCVRFARELLWDAPSPHRDRSSGPEGSRSGASASGAADHARRRRHLAAFVERELVETVRRSPFDGEIGTTRTVAFATVPLRPLHDAAKELAGATLNDAVLALVAGSLRHWIEAHHGSLAGVRARVPVSLHHEGDSVANRDSFFTLHLPLAEPDPVARLRAVHAATAVRKAEHDAEAREELLRRLGAHPHLEGLCERIERSPRGFALSVSNVPGPSAPVSVLGAPVTALRTLAEIGARHGLRIAVVSLAGELHFGLCADPAIVDGLDAMARGIEEEAAALLGA